MSRYPRKHTAYGGFTLPSGQTITVASGADVVLASGASLDVQDGADLNVAEGAAVNLAGVGANVAITGETGAVEAGQVVHVEYPAAAAAVGDRYVASANMKVGAYTLANGGLPGDGHAHNVTVTHTQVGGVTDTLGTITVAGTNINDEAITEVITPTDGGTTQGVKAFKSVTSVTGAGWVVDTGNDTVVVGFGDKLGLPFFGTVNTVLAAAIDGVREGTLPTVVRDADEIEKNTVELDSALDGSDVDVWLIVE